MDLRATPNLIHLVDSPSGRQSLQLEPARGQRVIVIAGKVWVTQAGDFKDYVLRQGEALTLDSPGMAIVSAFGPADIELIAPPAASTLDTVPNISNESLDRALHEAHRLRARAVHYAFAAAGAWLRNLGRRFVSTVAPC